MIYSGSGILKYFTLYYGCKKTTSTNYLKAQVESKFYGNYKLCQEIFSNPKYYLLFRSCASIKYVLSLFFSAQLPS